MTNWHEQHKQKSSVAEKIADKVSNFVGSWAFLLIHVVWFTAWIVFRIEAFPYGLLTMIVSLEAILLSTIIMISQSRAGDRDRFQAEADYKTNRDAKDEIEAIQVAVARIEDEHMKTIISKLDRFNNLLKKKGGSPSDISDKPTRTIKDKKLV